MKTFGKLNILFNNAGIWVANEVLNMSEEEWDKTIDINLKGVFLFSKASIPEMIKAGGGSIINTASVRGHVGEATGGAYCASKAGVILLTKVMAVELAKYNIRVNCVSPGEIVTPMHIRGFGGSEKMVEDIFAKPAEPKTGQLFIGTEEEKAFLARHPIGRFGGPIDVAYSVLFLASDESGFVTGSSLMVDGGYTAV